jgi:hypothetical protein
VLAPESLIGWETVNSCNITANFTTKKDIKLNITQGKERNLLPATPGSERPQKKEPKTWPY